jgi:DNA-binding NtrC family response regulator
MKKDNLMRNILLIDDDEDDFLFLSQALAAVSASLTLSCTQSTDHLLETIDRNQPALIFIDFYLPKRNGLDCLRQIKNHPAYKDIPVVMWSTSSVSKAVMAETQGAPHFFQKPSCYKDLVAELKTILQQNSIAFG